MSPIAQVCVCSDYFTVDEDGRLCLVPGTMGPREVLVFSTPGISTFEKADYPWLARVRVRAQGAGGGSGGSDPDPGESVWRPGGAGGGYSESLLDVSALGASETIVVGAGGAGGVGNSAGVTGGSSSFGGLVVAQGGQGGTATMPSGTNMTTASGVSGAPQGTGQIRVSGGAGGPAIRLAAITGLAGEGGDSHLGTGGLARANQGTGTIPQGYGGGAGGSAAADTATFNGSEGGDGIVIVELYG